MGTDLEPTDPGGELAREPVAAMSPATVRALWPWIGDIDRLVDGHTGWDIIVDPKLDPTTIAADHSTAVIRVGDREHLRTMLRVEADRYAAQLEADRAAAAKAKRDRALEAEAAGRHVIGDRDRLDAHRAAALERAAAAYGIRATIPPYRDPDAIPAPGDL